ncbi:MAG TPA: type VI secretion system tube protein Hcp [Pyrinomonadaceae bacterium]|jgi:type VI secretion system secreted protein Hcp
MAQKMFLKLDGVAGASVSSRHFGEIEISGWSFGGTQHKIVLGAAQNKLNKNLKSDLTVTKKPDNASRILLDACLTERIFSEAVLTIENLSADGNLLRSIILRLRGVAVTSVTSGSSEIITFSYEKAEIVHPAQALSAE